MGLPRRHRLAGLTLLLAGWALLELLTGADTGLRHVGPAVLLAAPLLLGRYVGETRIAAIAAARHAPRPRRAGSVAVPRRHARLMHRGGRLVAGSLAGRSPPVGVVPTA